MKNAHLIIILLLSTLIITSCSSDDNEEETPTINKTRLTNFNLDSKNGEFTYDSDGRLSSFSFDGSTSTLIYNSEGKIIQKGNETYEYNSQGRINKITVASTATLIDRVTTVIYNPQGKISRLEMSSKVVGGSVSVKYINLEYNSSNKLVSITDNDPSAFIDYKYIKKSFTLDDNDNAIEITINRSSNNIDFSLRRTYTYTYDNKKNPYYDILKSLGNDEYISLVKIIPSISSEINGTYSYPLERAYYYSPNNQLTSFHQGYDSEIGYEYNDEGYPTSGQQIGVKIENDGSSTNLSESYTWNYEQY